ncbi:DUF4190 domain-containing protein [Candidatus Woesearchaeota archaeon]|nr:MAG: DUF4190 domain-containing protein [Candidatus Woesearchaeota archaeon]
MKAKNRRDSNTVGIIALVLSFFVPVAGLILGIIALVRKEKSPALGILAIVISSIFLIIIISMISVFLSALTALS